MYSKFTDLLPKEVYYGENDEELQRPDEEAVKDATAATRAVLEKLTSSKITAAMPVRAAEKLAPAQYIRLDNMPITTVGSSWPEVKVSSKKEWNEF